MRWDDEAGAIRPLVAVVALLAAVGVLNSMGAVSQDVAVEQVSAITCGLGETAGDVLRLAAGDGAGWDDGTRGGCATTPAATVVRQESTTQVAVAAAPLGQAEPASLVAGVVSTGRTLIYVNNPEPLVAADLANAPARGRPGKALLVETLPSGNYRGFFEHVNQTGDPLWYGLYLFNPASPGGPTVTVQRTGRGYAAGGANTAVAGGAVRDLLNGAENTRLTLAPGSGGWIFTSEIDRQEAAPGAYLTGGVDFQTRGGNVILQQLAYRSDGAAGTDDRSALPGTYRYLGSVTEPRSGVPQNRVDKGTSPNSAAVIRISATVDDDDAGDVPVSYAQYGAAGPRGGIATQAAFVTNITPSRDPQAVSADMVTITTPDGRRVSPFQNSEVGGGIGNLANWGVEYAVDVTVNNTGDSPRVMQLDLEKVGNGNAFFAYKNKAAPWTAACVSPGTPNCAATTVPYLTFTAPPGTSTRTARFILGAPSAGALSHTLRFSQDERPSDR